MKVALVYDRVNKWGGAERVLLSLNKIFPNADLYTSVYNSRKVTWAKVFNVYTSFLQNFPKALSFHIFGTRWPTAPTIARMVLRFRWPAGSIGLHPITRGGRRHCRGGAASARTASTTSAPTRRRSKIHPCAPAMVFPHMA